MLYKMRYPMNFTGPRLSWVAFLALLLVSLSGHAVPTKIAVYADGLVNPRGLAFDNDGLLYVAEAGKPGDVSVPLPGAYGKAPLGDSGRISVIRGGKREDVAKGLPNMGLYGGTEILGPSAIANLNGRLFYAPAIHMTELPRLYEIIDGKLEVFAEIGEFNDKHPPPPSNGDASIGNPYDMVGVGDALYISDGNFNRVLKVDMTRNISVFAAYENSPVTTGLDKDKNGNLYVAQFSPAPYFKGSSTIDRITPDGAIEVGHIPGLSNAIDVVFDHDGTLYILQFASAFNADLLVYKPYGGKLLRVKDDRTTEEVVTNLNFPTAAIFGPDGALYVSNFGHQANDGQGQILRIELGEGAAVAPMAGSASGEQWQEPVIMDPLAEIEAGAGTAIVKIIEGPDIMKWGYDPSELTVSTGTDVIFVNVGQVPHTATANQGTFDTGYLKNSEQMTITMDKIGEHGFFCTPHPWMKGKINVEAAAGERPTVAQEDLVPAPEKKLERPELGFQGASPVQIALLLVVVFTLLFTITRLFGSKEN